MAKEKIRRKYVRGFCISRRTGNRTESHEDLMIKILSPDGTRFEEIIFDMSDHDMIRLFKRLRSTVETRLRAQVQIVRDKADYAGIDAKDIGL